MTEVVVIDYGMGNVLSVCRALEHCAGRIALTDRPEAVAAADRLVLPGVGAFADCVKALESRGLVEPVKEFLNSGRPFLGICVGMQILLDVGEEFGGYPGLGIIPGRVTEIDRVLANGAARKIPHIGWTSVMPPHGANDDRWADTMLAGTEPGTAFYFVHSFTAVPANDADLLATADYAGATVTAAVARDNVTGVQFHPEKSGPAGLAVIRTFISS
jgi:imidazole glycerol-phosphate synthase subunit HisH